MGRQGRVFRWARGYCYSFRTCERLPRLRVPQYKGTAQGDRQRSFGCRRCIGRAMIDASGRIVEFYLSAEGRKVLRGLVPARGPFEASAVATGELGPLVRVAASGTRVEVREGVPVMLLRWGEPDRKSRLTRAAVLGAAAAFESTTNYLDEVIYSHTRLCRNSLPEPCCGLG
jgi:hypothetical protein